MSNCWCHKCNPPGPLGHQHMILCPDCGNKRCPRASWHELRCTGSNATGQPGSVFGDPDSPEAVKTTDREIEVNVPVEPKSERPIRLVNQHVVDELRAENERLKAELDGKCAVCCTACKDMLTDDSCMACEVDNLRTENERLRDEAAFFQLQLAAAKRREEKMRADVAALREFVRKERVRALEASEDSDDTFDETELAGQFAAYCAVLMRLDELETFREVK